MGFLSFGLAYFIMSGVESAVVTEKPPSTTDVPSNVNLTWQLPTRRILRGMLVGETRPYMVYLRPVADFSNYVLLESHWLCGGVIVDKRYILTSAACIENAGNFYVVSGTHKWVPPEVHDNECVINGARRAIWKCVPHTFFFDGDAFDNIRWMVGDIAVVKVEDNFDFERKIAGCDFVPRIIKYNNCSEHMEESGTLGTIVGWGSQKSFVNQDSVAAHMARPAAENSVDLLEADVIVITKRSCKRHWAERYHHIIDNEMVCTKDTSLHDPMHDACLVQGIDCQEVIHSEEDYYSDATVHPISRRNMAGNSDKLHLHTAGHHYAKDFQTGTRRRPRINSGGFCENDHGGPLIEGHGKTSTVVGIMSACLTRELTHRCRGPFLYTSVYKYRNLIACAIYKDITNGCRRMLNDTNTIMKKTEFNWREPSQRMPREPLNYKETKMRQWAELVPQPQEPLQQEETTSSPHQESTVTLDIASRFHIRRDNPYRRFMRRFFS